MKMTSMNRGRAAKAGAVLAAGLAMLGTAGLVGAAENIVQQFNDASAATFARWWGAAGQTYAWDATSDAANDPNSGSQKITAVFNLAQYGGDNQYAARYDIPTFNGTDYTNLVFDIRFDPSSPVQGTSYGNLEFGLVPNDFSQILLGTVAIPSGTVGWTRVAARIDPATQKLESIRGVWFKIWSGNAGGLTGTSIAWIDNISINANTNVAPPPPPTITATRPNQGLRMFASQPGQQYQRQNIYTPSNPNYSWVGRTEPVTYSLTVADYPDGAHSGFQSHIFLIPVMEGTNLPNWETSADYSEPDLIFLDIGNGANGGGFANFRYKVNQPQGNAMVYNANPANGPVGTLANVGNPTPNGTWSITFNNDTNITLTAPSGATATATLPTEAAARFARPIHVYAGIQPNQPGNIGQSLTIKRVKISGTATPIDEDFSAPGVIGGGTWNLSASDAAGVVRVPSDAALWLSWPLPDTGWVLQWAEDLESNFWNDISFPGTANIGGQRRTLILQSELPVTSFTGNYFFQLIRR
jgi:hypothetical protein